MWSLVIEIVGNIYHDYSSAHFFSSNFTKNYMNFFLLIFFFFLSLSQVSHLAPSISNKTMHFNVSNINIINETLETNRLRRLASSLPHQASKVKNQLKIWETNFDKGTSSATTEHYLPVCVQCVFIHQKLNMTFTYWNDVDLCKNVKK